MSYNAGDSGAHSCGEFTVKENSPLVLQLWDVLAAEPFRAEIEISAVWVALSDVVIVPFTMNEFIGAAHFGCS